VTETRIAPTVSLASELLTRLPTMNEEEKRVGLEIYRQLALGQPVQRAGLAEALHRPLAAVEEMLGHTNLKSLTYADAEGRIIGFGGLAIREMPHRFTIAGRTLYTWCAWDSLFIPVVLGVEAEVDSPAPGNTARVRLHVAPDGVKRVQPQTAVMSFLLPSAKIFQGDALKAMASFCHHIFFFPNRETANRWTRDHPETMVISVLDAFQLGRVMVDARWRPGL
jgi:alkylmercury lyase